MELRVDTGSRATKDLDTAFRASIEAVADHLDPALRAGHGDFTATRTELEPVKDTEVLGARPASQRDRLRREHAVESIVLLAEESGHELPDHARTVAELVGGAPSSALDRFQLERVAKVVSDATSSPARELGHGVSIG